MSAAGKTKKQRPQASVPCEVFFACTLCGSRSRTVPQLHTHYRSNHKGELGIGKAKPRGKKDEVITIEDDDVQSDAGSTPSRGKGEQTASNVSSLSVAPESTSAKDVASTSVESAGESGRGKKRKSSGEGSTGKSPDVTNCNENADRVEKGSEKRLKTQDGEHKAEHCGGKETSQKSDSNDSTDSSKSDKRVNVCGSNSSSDDDARTDARGKPGQSPVTSRSSPTNSSRSDHTGGSPNKPVESTKSQSNKPQSTEKDCVITKKKNVPLGMLKGKNNSLMVIFQHADQTKPLPEGSSFKLRNPGGEQTYVVVANVDVDIIEHHGRPSSTRTK